KRGYISRTRDRGHRLVDLAQTGDDYRVDLIVANLRTQGIKIRFRFRVWAQQDLVAGNCLDTRTRNHGGHFIFEVGTYFQVLSDTDDKNLVEHLSFVLGIQPSCHHLNRFGTDGSEDSQHKDGKKSGAVQQATSGETR